MRILKTPLSEEDIAEVAQCMENGGIVLVPTDTVYGVAAHVYRPDAIDRIINMKGRDPSKPIQILASSVEAVLSSPHLIVSPQEYKVGQKFWPGPLTIVFEKNTGGTEGIRIPNNDVVRSICFAVGGGIRCTSANISSEPDALDAEAARAAIPDADILIDDGPVPIGKGSTVVKISGNTIQVFREGPITEKDIRSAMK